jgi:AraC-like DNA-binding protein
LYPKSPGNVSVQRARVWSDRLHVPGKCLPVDLSLPDQRDRFVGRALALMHDQPAQDWNLDELGRQVGLSRSALHERFAQLTGVPPMQYLAQWRMQVAARLLLETRARVASIALDVGYDSEAAFARAFKRLVGKPPGTWRRERDAALAETRFVPRATAAAPY